jgi:two-component system response regulator DevR
MPIRIVIVEDQPFCRDVIRWLWVEKLGYEVAAEAASSWEAVEVIRRERPELALIDLHLADENQWTGFDVAAVIAKELPQVRCVLMSAHCNDMVIHRLEQARPFGFIDKDFHGMEQLRHALQEVAEGRQYFSAGYFDAVARQRQDPDVFYKLLSRREQQALTLIADTMSDREIAACMGLALSTAATYRATIMRKLGQHSTSKLVKYAIDHGFAQFGQRPGLPAPNCLA